ncbi:hypothetical protein [Saccharicrinis aurantiacus]|uniref:hypothetical protein n=1 Tax=Saccharicrinis aurantiacus TaxID=1849719 RepID=UPI002491DE30|nr:hypothetical protein [Saccharicrinis aurantiacus]
MKKLLFSILFLLTLLSTSQAQEVGIRFHNFSGSQVAIDGVFSLGKFSRLHTDITFGGGMGIDCLWDFWYQNLGGEKGFMWYTGVGPTAFFGDAFKFGAAGEVGIEYHFSSAPLAIGVDWRPYFQMIDTTTFNADSFGLNIRICF